CRIQIGSRSAVDLTECRLDLRQCRRRGYRNNNRYLRARYALTVVTDLCSIICTCSKGSCRCKGGTSGSRSVPNHGTCSACRIQVCNRSAVDLTECLRELCQCRSWGFRTLNHIGSAAGARRGMSVMCSVLVLRKR